MLQSKGENVCGNILCQQKSASIYEMNFGYMEEGKKRNALVKVSVCGACSEKLNYKMKLKKLRGLEKEE